LTYEHIRSLYGVGNFARRVKLVVRIRTVWCRGADGLLICVFSFRLHSSLCSRTMILFLWVGKYFCLAICPFIKQSNL